VCASAEDKSNDTKDRFSSGLECVDSNNQNCFHEEIKSRLNSGNACVHSVQRAVKAKWIVQVNSTVTELISVDSIISSIDDNVGHLTEHGVSECAERERDRRGWRRKLPVSSCLTQKEALTSLSILNSVIRCRDIDDTVVKGVDTSHGFVPKIHKDSLK
jgi:hypothetical protein